MTQTKPASGKQKQPKKSASPSRSPMSASTIYTNYTIWTEQSRPTWHPIKKMRYVFFRMIDGITITDALAEIAWSASEFWHLVDLKRHGPFREEYKRAKLLQGRAFADSVTTIAEGRDPITRAHARRLKRLVDKSLRRINRTKSSFKAKLLFEQLMADLREHDKIIITRNKLQIDAAKWIAKTSNPSEYSETSKVALGGLPTTPGDAPDAPIQIQFIGPDGTVVPL